MSSLIFHSRLIEPPASLADEALQKDILSWRQPFEAFSRVVIGQTAMDLDQSTCQQRECTLGNAVTDSMLYARRQLGASIDFAIHNAGEF